MIKINSESKAVDENEAVDESKAGQVIMKMTPLMNMEPNVMEMNMMLLVNTTPSGRELEAKAHDEREH